MFRLEVLAWQQTDGKGAKPERIPLPRPAAEARSEAKQQQDRMAEKARKHALRDQRRSATT